MNYAAKHLILTLIWMGFPGVRFWIWKLGRVRDTKFGTNVFNNRFLSAAKSQGYSFLRFWVIKGKPTVG